MKKLTLIFVALLMAATTFAQQDEGATDLKQNKFGRNWEVRVNFAPQSYMGEYIDCAKRFADSWIFPSVGLGFQKWISPSLGFGLDATYSRYKGFYPINTFNTFARVTDENYEGNVYIAKGHMMNIDAKMSANLANLFGGYKEFRIFNPVAYIGGGFLVPLAKINTYRSTGVTFNAGMLFQFRVSKHLLIDLNIEGALVSDNFEGELWRPGCNPETEINLDGILRIGAGITYQFNYVKKKNAQDEVVERLPWVKAEDGLVDTTQNMALRQQLAQAQKETQAAEKEAQEAREALEKAQQTAAEGQNSFADAAQIEKLQKELADAKNQISKLQSSTNQIVFDSDSRGFWQIITFFIDKYNVTNRQRVNLMAAADIIKATPGLKYTITGYADSQTANPTYNLELSKKRVNTVYNILVNEMGIPADRLVVDYKGGVDNLFLLDPECSRAVVIRPIQNK